MAPGRQCPAPDHDRAASRPAAAAQVEDEQDFVKQGMQNQSAFGETTFRAAMSRLVPARQACVYHSRHPVAFEKQSFCSGASASTTVPCQHTASPHCELN